MYTKVLPRLLLVLGSLTITALCQAAEPNCTQTRQKFLSGTARKQHCADFAELSGTTDSRAVKHYAHARGIPHFGFRLRNLYVVSSTNRV